MELKIGIGELGAGVVPVDDRLSAGEAAVVLDEFDRFYPGAVEGLGRVTVPPPSTESDAPIS